MPALLKLIRVARNREGENQQHMTMLAIFKWVFDDSPPDVLWSRNTNFDINVKGRANPLFRDSPNLNRALTVVHLVEDDVVWGGEVVEAEGQSHDEQGGSHAVHGDVEREGVVGTPIKGS